MSYNIFGTFKDWTSILERLNPIVTLQRVDVSQHLNSTPKLKPEILNSLPTTNHKMVTGVYRSNKLSKVAAKPTITPQKLPAKRKLSDDQQHLSQKTLQDRPAKKLKQNMDKASFAASEVTEEISVPEVIAAEDAPESVVEDMTAEDDKSDDMPLATLKTKSTEAVPNPAEDLRRQSDISEDDIPLATVKAKLEEKIKLVEDLSKPEIKGTKEESSKALEPVETAKSSQKSEPVEPSPQPVESVPETDQTKQKIFDLQKKTDALNCPSKDDVPLSETLLTKIKSIERVGEVMKSSSKPTGDVTNGPVADQSVPTKLVAEKPIARKTDEVNSGLVQPVTNNPAAIKSIVTKPVSKQVESKTIASKPAASKPVSIEPVIADPVGAKPVVAKPIATKPTAVEPLKVKTIPTKSSEIKPNTGRAIAVKPVAGKSAVATSAPPKPIASEQVSSKIVSIKPVTAKTTTVKRVIKSVVVKPASFKTVTSTSTGVKPTAPTLAENSKTRVVVSTKASKPMESTPDRLPKLTSAVLEPDTKNPVIDLTEPADDVKQEIEDPEFDAARVANRRKSLNELIDLCSDTSSEPPNRSPASSTSCKRYKDYDNIDEQLEADMEREQQYFDGVDEAYDRNLWNPLDEEQLPSSKFKYVFTIIIVS